MEHQHVKKLLPEYLDNQLNPSKKRKVEEHLRICSDCRKELQELSIVLNSFAKEREQEPSASVRRNFYRMLEHEKEALPQQDKTFPQDKNRGAFRTKDFVKTAAVIGLLFCGYLLGKFHQPEQSADAISEYSDFDEKQKSMLALLDSPSASKRIQGMNFFETSEELDQEIIEALSQRMFKDENSNVRLAAVEALSNFTTSETVKKHLIAALGREKDPVIQIRLIEILVKIQEKKAAEPMEKLLQKESTEPFVKEQIHALLPSIT